MILKGNAIRQRTPTPMQNGKRISVLAIIPSVDAIVRPDIVYCIQDSHRKDAFHSILNIYYKSAERNFA